MSREYMMWRVRLWVERAYDRARYDHQWQSSRFSLKLEDHKRTIALLNRIDPFSSVHGYRHGRIRHYAFMFAAPRDTFRRARTGWWFHIIDWLAVRLNAKPYPGKFEGEDSQLISRWLYEHAEWCDDETGDADAIGYYWLHNGIMPWSRVEEHYIVRLGSQGFVTATRYDSERDAADDWQLIQQEYEEVEVE